MPSWSGANRAHNGQVREFHTTSACDTGGSLVARKFSTVYYLWDNRKSVNVVLFALDRVDELVVAHT